MKWNEIKEDKGRRMKREGDVVANQVKGRRCKGLE